MRQAFTIAKNSVSLVLREILNKGALFILLVLIGRVLGKEALGRYSLALAISQIFFFGTELGLNTLVIREVAKERLLAGKFLINIGTLRIVSGIVTLLLIYLTTLVLGARGETAAAIYLCGISYLFVNILSLYTSVFRAYERMELELLISFIKNVIFLPLAIWAVLSGLGLISVFNIFLASNLLALAAADVIFRREVGILKGWRLDFSFLKGRLIETSPLWLSQLFGIAYLRLAPLLLFRVKGEGAVGLYNAGFVVLDGFWILAGCIVYSVFPIISRTAQSDDIKVRQEYMKGLKFVFLSFLGLAALAALLARRFIPLFYGAGFIELVPLGRIFSVAAVLVAVDTYNGMTIIAIGKQFFLPFINALGLLVNLGFNLFFISRFGYIGSAYALLISESMVFVLMLAALKRAGLFRLR